MTDNNQIFVSAILPVFNAEDTVIRAVESLLNQPEINEIIIVEDGSEDDSLMICKSLADSNSKIQILQHSDGKNKGAPASRNLGLSKAKNQWIQFMDADDVLLPRKVASQIPYCHDEISFIIGQFIYKDDDKAEKSKNLTDVWSGLISTRLGQTASNLWNSKWIKAAGNWNESLPNVQEYHLMFEMMKINENVAFSKEYLTEIYYQPNSISNSETNLFQKRNTYFSFRKKIKEYLIQNGKYNFTRNHYFNVCTGEMLRYHCPPFPVHFNKVYYSLYKGVKSLLN